MTIELKLSPKAEERHLANLAFTEKLAQISRQKWDDQNNVCHAAMIDHINKANRTNAITSVCHIVLCLTVIVLAALVIRSIT